MSDEARDRDDSVHRDGGTPDGGGGMSGHDPLDLLCLSRRAAARDCVIVMICLISAMLSARLWYYAHASWDDGSDILTLWLLPSFIFTSIACGLAVLLTTAEQWDSQILWLRANEMDRQAFWGIAGAALAYAILVAWLGIEWCARHIVLEQGASGDATVTGAFNHWQAWRQISAGSTLTLLTGGAVMEEIAFRGLLLPRLRRITGRWWSATAICVLLFGVFHLPGGFHSAAIIALVSLAFCVVFIRSRSLLTAILAHALYNIGQYALGSW